MDQRRGYREKGTVLFVLQVPVMSFKFTYVLILHVCLFANVTIKQYNKSKIVPNKVKARWTNTRLQASCSSAVSFLNKVFLGVFNKSVVWFNDSLIKKQSLVAIYWCNNVTCRMSHFKIPTTYAQTDILSGNEQTDKHPSLSNSRVRTECCIIVLHMIIAGIVLFFLGFYCLEGTSLRPSSQFLCPQGYYCEEGTGVPHGSPCPAGTAGGQLGQTSRAACKRCAEGRFCPAG